MRLADTYPAFAAEVSRDTSVEHLRKSVTKWMSYGLCVPMGFGAHCDRWFVNAAMSCETPVRFHYIARHALGAAGKPLVLEVLHRCRKCKPCEKARSRMWAARARNEFEQSARTWFGTLTLGPQHHAAVDQVVAARSLWPDRSRLSDAQFKSALFRARASVIGEHVSSWFSIIRERAKMLFNERELVRYLLVAERHDSAKTSDFLRGRPHFHMILHEQVRGAVFTGTIMEGDNGEIVRRKERTPDGWAPFWFASDDSFARRAWCLGHSKFKYCVDARAAFYICNYLYESDQTRMRCSLLYGRRQPAGDKDKSVQPISPANRLDDSGREVNPPQRSECN